MRFELLHLLSLLPQPQHELLQLFVLPADRPLHILPHDSVNLLHVLPHRLRVLSVLIALLLCVKVERGHLFELVMEVFSCFVTLLKLSAKFPQLAM